MTFKEFTACDGRWGMVWVEIGILLKLAVNFPEGILARR